jgi:ketosteroid isomerase-like protein
MGIPASPDEQAARVAHFYATVSPDTLDRIDDLYAPDARFKDPFNEVQGRRAIRAIFEHMYRQVHAPRFVVHTTVAQGDVAFLTWTMFYRSAAGSKDEQSIRGCTELRFDHGSRVSLHRDYWDAAEELYEKLPLLGALMRVIKRRLKA